MNTNNRYHYIAFGDETFVLRRPHRKTTVCEKGARHVQVKGAACKEGLTVWLSAYVCFPANGPIRPGQPQAKAGSYSCTLIPPYVISQHQKKNEKHEAHPDNNGCIVSKTDSGWQNEESMIRYIENDSIMKPVKQQAKVKSIFKTPPPTRLSAFNTLPKASASHPGLMIFDLHASHRTEDVIKCLAKRGWHCVFVPGGSTGDVQIMDTHVNRPFKHMIRELYESEHGEDDLSDEDGVEVLSPDEVPEKRIRKSHQTLSVQCSRIDKVWKQMKPHVVKGFEANVLPLLSAAPPAADSEEEIQKAAVLAEKTQIEQEIVDRFLGTCVSADTFQSLVADINSIGNEEPNPESTTLEQLIKLKHMNLYADDDNAQDEDGEAKVDYLETTLLALEKRCGYCSDPLEASGALIGCKICGGSSHQFCVTQSQG